MKRNLNSSLRRDNDEEAERQECNTMCEEHKGTERKGVKIWLIRYAEVDHYKLISASSDSSEKDPRLCE